MTHAVHRETIPFCPNEKCDFHSGFSTRSNYKCKGFYRTKSGLVSQRFRCLTCGICFSEQSFRFNYRFKKKDPALSAKILKTFLLGASNRGVARYLRVSEHCVRQRLKRMAHWALVQHTARMRKGWIREPVCYDGLENFAGSQYDPNHINQAVGRDTLFVYDFNYAPLNRKGKMSPRQKLANRHRQNVQGLYSGRAVRKSSAVIFRRLAEKVPVNEKLQLLTDEHFQYRRALQHDLRGIKIEHLTISSKATRNFQNILFPVNHADLIIRQQVAAFSRETIAFAKTPARMCQKYALFMVHKNYMSPQFTKKLLSRPRAHLESPAQAIGLESRVLAFHEFFGELKTFKQLNAPTEWEMFANDQVPYTRKKMEVLR